MNSGLFTGIVEWDQSYGGKEFWGGVDFIMQQYFSEHESF